MAEISLSLTAPPSLSAKTTGVFDVEAVFGGLSKSIRVTVLPKRLVALIVNPISQAVIVGQTATFGVTGVFSDATTADLSSVVMWSVLNGAIGSVSNSLGHQGKFTGIQAGTTKVIATYAGFHHEANVTVTNPTLNLILLSSASSVSAGLTNAITATGYYSDGSSADLTEQANWSTSDNTVVTVSNLSGQRGRVMGISVGSATISASFGLETGTLPLFVSSPVLSSLALTPALVSLPKGLTQSFVATGTYSDGSTLDLTSSVQWESTNTAVATMSNNSGTNGLATALTVGNTTIKATLGSIVATRSLAITPAILMSTQITPQATTVTVGDQLLFTMNGVYSDQSQVDLTSLVSWSVQDGVSGSIGNTTGQFGRFTALQIGTTKIVANYLGTNYEADITVTGATLNTVSVNAVGPVVAGLFGQMIATGYYSDGSTTDLSESATWTTSDAAVATVSNSVGQKGKIAGVTVGTATITATISGVSGQIVLSIAAPTLTSITVTPVSQAMAKGRTQQYVAIGNYSDGSTTDITSLVLWESSDLTVSTISNMAGTKGVAFAVNTGASDIKATLGAVSSQQTLTVTPAQLLSIVVTPHNSTILILGHKHFTATGTYTDGSQVNITSSVVWSSSNVLTATISNSPGTKGRAAGVGLGSTTIRATAPGGISGSTLLNGIL